MNLSVENRSSNRAVRLAAAHTAKEANRCRQTLILQRRGCYNVELTHCRNRDDCRESGRVALQEEGVIQRRIRGVVFAVIVFARGLLNPSADHLPLVIIGRVFGL